MIECRHELPIDWCADCNGKAKQKEREEREAREELLLKEGWFVSKFPGRCGKCGTGFRIGEPIRKREPKKGDLFFKYKASCCAEEG